MSVRCVRRSRGMRPICRTFRSFLTETWPGSISHFWSLAVEEQFYLVWPWLIVFAPRRFLAPAIVMAIAGAPIFRWWLATQGYRENLLASPDARQPRLARHGRTLGASCGHPAGRLGSVESRCSAWPLLIAVARRQKVAVGPLPLPLMAVKQTLQAVVFAWLVHAGGGGISRAAGPRPVRCACRLHRSNQLRHLPRSRIRWRYPRRHWVNSRSLPEPWRLHDSLPAHVRRGGSLVAPDGAAHQRSEGPFSLRGYSLRSARTGSIRDAVIAGNEVRGAGDQQQKTCGRDVGEWIEAADTVESDSSRRLTPAEAIAPRTMPAPRAALPGRAPFEAPDLAPRPSAMRIPTSLVRRLTE